MRKGQILVFEQVLLFGVSVAIFVACFAIFQLYQSHFGSIAVNDHTKAVRDMIYTHIIELTRFGDMNASIIVKIPKEISGEYYKVQLTDTAINITTMDSGVTATTGLQMLTEKYDFSGETTSSKGEIMIYKKGNEIKLY